MRNTIRTLSCAGILALAGVAELRGTDPTPILDFDFGKAINQQVTDAAGSGLVLAAGRNARIENGAIIFEGGDFAVTDPPAYQKWHDGMDFLELAAAFWIRFDQPRGGCVSSAKDMSLGLFDCRRKEDGTLEVGIPTPPTELFAEKMTLQSRHKIEYGKWYHVEFNYSTNRQRMSLYLDGRWQNENVALIMPYVQTTLGDFRMGNGFRGAVRGLKVYAAAIFSEELAIAENAPTDFDALAARANAIGQAAANANLKAWAAELAARADRLKAGLGQTTIAQVRRLNRDLANAETLAKGLAENEDRGKVAHAVVTCYVVPATNQEMNEPYTLPQSGRLSNQVRIAAAQGEFEPASVVIVPFKPVKAFTLEASSLSGPGCTIPAQNLDIKLVKRWFRTGGAWMSYHTEKRRRILTPDWLINDDKILKVDEFRLSNYLLMHFRSGDQYVDISRRVLDLEHFDLDYDKFYDAKTLQPVELPEAGRNQQYYITLKVPSDACPGFYTASIRLKADGTNAGAIEVTVRVLPFTLPDPKTYENLDKTYFSHVNYAPPRASVYECGLQMMKDHNMMHAARVINTPDRIACARKIGYPLTQVFGGDESLNGRSWSEPFGTDINKITPEFAKQLDKIYVRRLNRYLDYLEKNIGDRNVEFYICTASEASAYHALVTMIEHAADLLHANSNGKFFTHGMIDANVRYMSDFSDGNSSTTSRRDWADIWHKTGGINISYCDPFPGAENPAMYRRKLGLYKYKARYDGDMMHGFLNERVCFNEFTDDPGGDGSYRNFCMVYPQYKGLIDSLKMSGYREALDDVRYATKLQQLAHQHRDSKDQRLAREAKRQLAWLETVDGEKMDMDAFRTNVIHRILVMLELAKVCGGKES